LAVRFEAQSGGVRVVKTFTFRRGHYDIQVEHKITNVGSAEVPPSLYLQLVRDGSSAGDDSYFARSYTGPAFYSDVDKYRKISFEDVDKKKADDLKPADNGWVAWCNTTSSRPGCRRRGSIANTMRRIATTCTRLARS